MAIQAKSHVVRPRPRPSMAPVLLDQHTTERGDSRECHAHVNVTHVKLNANSCKNGLPEGPYYDMELDHVSGKEALSFENKDYKIENELNHGQTQSYKIGQWTKWHQKWENELEDLKELALPSASCETPEFETWCHENNNDEDEDEDNANAGDFEWVTEEPESEPEEIEDVIKRTNEVLSRHLGRAPAPVRRSCKRQRSPLPVRSGRSRRGPRRGKRNAKLLDGHGDGNCSFFKVNVNELRYSQLSVKKEFQCGRAVRQLIQDLWDGNVSLCAPFLRLTVFETTDPITGTPILKCIDNRRLFALKQYAKLTEDEQPELMVNIRLFSEDTLRECWRFWMNSDDTSGYDVKLRKGLGKGKGKSNMPPPKPCPKRNRASSLPLAA